jgi:hypothetical protein
MMLMLVHHDATLLGMRTTVTLERDVAAAVDQLRRREGIGVSEALNRLVRAALVEPSKREPFRQRTVSAGRFLVDVSNVHDAIEAVEGPDYK